MTRKTFALFLTVIFMNAAGSSFVLAETIILKSGDKIEANILEKNNDTVIIDYKGSPITYYTFEIEAIDGKPLAAEKAAKETSEEEITRITAITAEEYSKRASVYFNRGNFSQAVSDFSRAIKIKPDLAQAFLNRGLSYLNQNMPDKAVADFNKAIELDPKSAEAYYIRGLSFANKGKAKEAISDYDKAIQLNPQYLQAYLNRGFVNLNTGNLEKAIVDLDKVIKINPQVPAAFFLRGVAYTNKGNLDKALSDFDKAIDLNPKYAEAYANRGLVTAFKAKSEQASADPSSPKAFVNIGTTYTDKKAIEKALADCAKAIEINPNYADAYINRIRIYTLSRDFGKARQEIDKVKGMGGKIPSQIIEDLDRAEGR